MMQNNDEILDIFKAARRQRLTTRTVVYSTAEQAAEIEADAKEAGLTRSDFLKACWILYRSKRQIQAENPNTPTPPKSDDATGSHSAPATPATTADIDATGSHSAPATTANVGGTAPATPATPANVG